MKIERKNKKQLVVIKKAARRTCGGSGSDAEYVDGKWVWSYDIPG